MTHMSVGSYWEGSFHSAEISRKLWILDALTMPLTAKPTEPRLADKNAPNDFLSEKQLGKAATSVTAVKSMPYVEFTPRDCELLNGLPSPCSRRLIQTVVRMPVVIKLKTLTNERLLNRASPQIPCPLVQPFPSFVPKPTRNPYNKVSEANKHANMCVSIDRAIAPTCISYTVLRLPESANANFEGPSPPEARQFGSIYLM